MSKRIVRAGCVALAATAAVLAAAPPANAGVGTCSTNYQTDLTGAPTPIPSGFDFRPTGDFVVYVGFVSAYYGECVYDYVVYCPLTMLYDFVNNPPNPTFVTDYAGCTTT